LEQRRIKNKKKKALHFRGDLEIMFSFFCPFPENSKRTSFAAL